MLIRSIAPRSTDVLSQRGGRSNRHPGTINYRALCDAYKPAYQAIEGSHAEADAAKNRIAMEVWDELTNQGARFLTMNSSGFWELLPHTKILVKIKQYLRTRPAGPSQYPEAAGPNQAGGQYVAPELPGAGDAGVATDRDAAVVAWNFEPDPVTSGQIAANLGEDPLGDFGNLFDVDFDVDLLFKDSQAW